MKNALILHGTDATSHDNWFPWLKNELEKIGCNVWVPDLPKADWPNMKRYNKHIFDNKNWKFNVDTVIVGHSSGAVALLGLLQKLPLKNKVDTCILVGVFRSTLDWENLKDLFNIKLDFKKIKKMARRFVFVHSNDDPFCPLDDARYLSEKLGGELVILKGQKHFSMGPNLGGSKYKKFPLILEILEEK